ncbi:family 1 glycosylhydrolase [Paenibacillus sp. N4]|uniref:glycoside hydrolase family 1 protein n=1 Tax=Paenibacillus vietnamensis TaxID=2590547 RepID=UPI001CD188C9|nr:family 1 glycosylhydrolase [Paenibacillus vietnamensis]MCA0755776.1 family 1 glycosylhydrolase [Paenibacillus vietnamensis]
MTHQFPDNFLWGASTAAHQVEGNNTNSDFWLMENLEGSVFKEPSGSAVDHYRLFREDIARMAEMGFNAYRFSFEWARIEPEEGRFDPAELGHYRDVLLACKEWSITPIVTLHHFSSPQWLIKQGGWEAAETPARFARYCAHVMNELGDLIPYVCTINEANISIGIKKIMKRHELQSGAQGAQVGMNMDRMAQMQKYFEELGKAFGVPHTEVHSFLAPRSEKGLEIIFQAHMEAKAAIRLIRPQTRIGLSLSLYDIQSRPGGEEQAAHALQEEFLQFIPYLKDDDFFGLQNYTRVLYGPDGILPIPDGAEITQMGNEFYPEALGAVVRYVAKHLEIPIMISENGIATDDDTRRVVFIDRALKGVHDCISEGIQVLGYMHWSLMDNFEWQLGFAKRFGLIEVNRATQERTIKPSGLHLGNIAKRNAIEQA